LEVRDLKTSFFTRRGVVRAVDGVSFSLDRGETLGLVGESGCGKTITCMSILRLVPKPAGKIVEGQIVFDGQNLLGKTEDEMRKIRGGRISMVLQDPMTSLNPVFTIGNQTGEVIALHQNARGRTLLEKVREVLRLVRIPSPEVAVKNYPHQMSGGMRQRVVGAIAISCQPDLLIADEPTTSLDVTIQAQYLKLLKDIQQQLGMAMIFITHDFGIVARMCDRVAVMYAGKIVESATTRELFNNPTHPYTVALLRSLPRIDVRMEKLYSIEGQPPTLLDPPLGCMFAPRCEAKDERCKDKMPPATQVGEGHIVSCWLSSSGYHGKETND
jgi:oligopeptide/dipeptide ABC transporter ATP-binding protein